MPIRLGSASRKPPTEQSGARLSASSAACGTGQRGRAEAGNVRALEPRPATTLNLAVRTQVEPASFGATLRRAVTAIDAKLACLRSAHDGRALFESVAQPRFRTALLGVFAALALVMAVVGLYAVMAFSVAQRTHELGIRIALGAQRRDVIGLVLRQGVKLVGIGILIGLAGAWALTRVLTTLLYEVKPTDPLTFLAVPVLLIAVAILACWLPARHAARVDPITALRYE